MDFQKLLLDVGKALRKDEVKALAFLCTDLVGQNLTSVDLASDLFSRLMDHDYLSPERPHLLTELLWTIKRTRLVHDLGLNDQVSTTNSLISPYRKLLYNLSENITNDELKHVKFLLNKQLPRRKLDENVTTLEVFLVMEHMDLLSSTNLSFLESIMEPVCPTLKEKISRFEATHDTEIFTGPIAQKMGLEQNQASERDRGRQRETEGQRPIPGERGKRDGQMTISTVCQSLDTESNHSYQEIPGSPRSGSQLEKPKALQEDHYFSSWCSKTSCCCCCLPKDKD